MAMDSPVTVLVSGPKDAAFAKPGVHASKTPGRFCSCDQVRVPWIAMLPGNQLLMTWEKPMDIGWRFSG